LLANGSETLTVAGSTMPLLIESEATVPETVVSLLTVVDAAVVSLLATFTTFLQSRPRCP